LLHTKIWCAGLPQLDSHALAMQNCFHDKSIEHLKSKYNENDLHSELTTFNFKHIKSVDILAGDLIVCNMKFAVKSQANEEGKSGGR
jgi:hypothetical protein